MSMPSAKATSAAIFNSATGTDLHHGIRSGFSISLSDTLCCSDPVNLNGGSMEMRWRSHFWSDDRWKIIRKLTFRTAPCGLRSHRAGTAGFSEYLNFPFESADREQMQNENSL